jgi:hypothetical protein
MNPFDLHTIHFLNSFAQRSWVFDSLIGQLQGNDLLKGGVIMALFWWAWIRYGNAHPENKEKLLFGLISGVFATFLARVLALMLPFRVRPLHNLQLNFRLPYWLAGVRSLATTPLSSSVLPLAFGSYQDGWAALRCGTPFWSSAFHEFIWDFIIRQMSSAALCWAPG